MAKIEFKTDNVTAADSFLLRNFTQKKVDGELVRIKIIEELDEDILFKDGTSITVDKKTLDTLVKTRNVRSKKEVKERERLMEGHTPLYEMTNEERNLLLSNMPYEV